MDEATAKLFEQMNDEWQEMARNGWVDITTKFAPDAPEDWASAVQGNDLSNAPAGDDSRRGARGSRRRRAGPRRSEQGASPEGDGTPPFALSLLSSEYTEAYELIPEGSLLREYMDIRLRQFSERGWESVKAQPDEPYPRAGPEAGRQRRARAAEGADERRRRRVARREAAVAGC